MDMSVCNNRLKWNYAANVVNGMLKVGFMVYNNRIFCYKGSCVDIKYCFIKNYSIKIK